LRPLSLKPRLLQLKQQKPQLNKLEENRKNHG
jgi:hypothetical protein